jgi:streptomycin 6-kinase
MKTLTQNIIATYGKQGEEWIANLPATIEALVKYWNLSHFISIDNQSFNYVAKAMANINQAVVLKISCDAKSMTNEIQALKHFNGQGSIQFIDYHSKYHALLLQQAIPGITLKALYPTQIEYVMNCYVDTMRKLHSKHLSSKHSYSHIGEWLRAIDRLIPSKPCPVHLLEKAIFLKNTLLASMSKPIFLHGDLHHDNILKNNDDWLAIDPKGVVGEPEFEIAAFDFMYIAELANNPDIKAIFDARINLLAHKSGLNAQRIKDWVFVRLILMAAWHIEDHGDPSWAIQLAETVQV